MTNRGRMFSSLVFLLVAAIMVPSITGRFAADETTVTELAPGVFFRKTQTEPEFIGCNQGWVEFKDFVLVIDSNFPNQAEVVIDLIRQQTDKPIKYVFDTHHHGDHADGNAIFKKIGATPIASQRSRAMFETLGVEGFETSKKEKPDEYGPLKYEYPTIYFPERMIFDDGEMRVELIWSGHAHTIGDAVAWLPRHGILFTGDSIVNGAFNFTGHSNTASWINVIDKLSELPIKTIAPGHGEPSNKGLLKTQKRYFVEMRKIIGKAIKDGKSLDEIKESIQLPFYEKWTGVNVKERTENIEHIYGELTGK